jgi:hypothetical protein
MIYVSSQPDIPYFHWQVEVYARNFIRQGIDASKIHAIFLIQGQKTQGLLELEKRLPIQIFCYEIEPRPYVAMYKPQGMSKHAKYLKQKFFYHDSDIIFVRPLNLDALCTCKWYGSDCRAYLGVEYIKSKGEGLLEAMAESISLNPAIIEHNKNNVVGAQYFLNDTSKEFWEKVESDSLVLLKTMQTHKTQIGLKHPIQSWTAEMWSTLWNMYAFGKTVEVIKELDFTFSTSKIERLNDVKILHNAGVLPQNKDQMFYKGDYLNRSPIGLNHDHLSREFAAWKYVEEISYF